MDSFVTGSRAGDLLLFLVLAALIVGFAPRLRVYYEVPGWAIDSAQERAAEPAETSR